MTARQLRYILPAALLGLALLLQAVGATCVFAAASTATTAVTCNVGYAIEVTLPGQITIGELSPGGNGYHETTLQATIKSNAPWKIALKCDQADGKMRESNGTGYVENGKKLTFPLNWKVAGEPVSAYKPLSDQEAIIIPESAATGSGGRTVTINLGQKAAYDDIRLAAAGSTYQMAISLTATQLY